MNEYEKEIFQWLEDAGLNPVHHNMAVPHLEVSAQCGLNKTPKNSQDFDLKRVKTPKKGNFSTRNSQELYAEWNSLPFGFFVSYLCVWKRDDTHAWDTQNTFWSPLA